MVAFGHLSESVEWAHPFLFLMADDERMITMLPLSRVGAMDDHEVSSRPADGVASSRVQGQFADVGRFLPVMVDVLPTAVLIIDERYRVVVANGAARRLLAEEGEPLLGYSVGRFLSLARLEGARVDLLKQVGTLTYRDTILREGVERELDISVEFLETAGREFLCATLVDQTHSDRERAEWVDSQHGSAPISVRLDQAHRLEALGHLTGTLAHDFNNLLGVIMASLEVAERRVESGQDPLVDIQRAATAAKRSIESTTEILRYARTRSPQSDPISLSSLLGEVRGLIVRALGESVSLVFETSETPLVRIGAAQLETALLNLVINARDAVPEGGEIRIVLCPRTLGEDEALGLGLVAGEYVSISVADSGPGMTEEIQRRVFEPFYTTKPEGRGTGLGLSTVRSVAQKFGGAVNLDSSPGRGTRVELLFPAV